MATATALSGVPLTFQTFPAGFFGAIGAATAGDLNVLKGATS